jgi:hypothetical protein
VVTLNAEIACGEGEACPLGLEMRRSSQSESEVDHSGLGQRQGTAQPGVWINDLFTEELVLCPTPKLTPSLGSTVGILSSYQGDVVMTDLASAPSLVS